MTAYINIAKALATLRDSTDPKVHSEAFNTIALETTSIVGFLHGVSGNNEAIKDLATNLQQVSSDRFLLLSPSGRLKLRGLLGNAAKEEALFEHLLT
jgi:hypothetical protein